MLMKPVARRTVIRGLGQTAMFGGLAASFSQGTSAGQAPARPAPAAPLKVCLTMLYPSGEGLSFDADGFRDRHLAVLKTAYGASVERIELRVPVLPTPPAPVEGQPAPALLPPPRMLAAVTMWLADAVQFSEKTRTASKAVTDSMATITKAPAIAQLDMVEGEAGDAATSILGGTTVVSQYFFGREGGTWDGAYFGKTFVPKMMAAYGGAAVQRIAVMQGVAPTGSKPVVTGAIHVYLKDADAFDAAAASESVKALATEVQQNSSLNPMTLLMTVHATA